ncbi:vacuolar cation/proton exchanger 5 isoform X5 [Spatholobus suberectus]|nr:vacuolar cation/proton exchanger 5 isoform X5 [Spatholobus suberectus]
MAFTVVFHHMGKFGFKPSLHYIGGEVHAIHGQDIDTWSLFEAKGLLKDLSDAMELGNQSMKYKCEMGICVEHTLSKAELIDSICSGESENEAIVVDNDNDTVQLMEQDTVRNDDKGPCDATVAKKFMATKRKSVPSKVQLGLLL